MTLLRILGLLLATAISAAPALGRLPSGYPRSYSQIVAAAAQQGELSIYSTTDTRELTDLLRDFGSLYPGIEVHYAELSSTELYDRFVREVSERTSTADLLWSAAMDLQIKLVNDGYAQPYASQEKPHLPQWAIWKNEAYGVTAEPIVLAYNKRLIPPAEVPHSHADLEQLLRMDPKYAGRVASYDPERSGTGFLYLTQDVQVTRDTWKLIGALGRAKAQLFTSTKAMLKRVAAGECLLAYNVVGSYALEEQARSPSLGVVLPRDYTLVTSRIALIPAEARHPDAAKLFLDYLLSKRGQTQLTAKHMTAVRADVPPLQGARPPENLTRAIRVGPDLLAGLDKIKRERFLNRWRRALAAQN